MSMTSDNDNDKFSFFQDILIELLRKLFQFIQVSDGCHELCKSTQSALIIWPDLGLAVGKGGGGRSIQADTVVRWSSTSVRLSLRYATCVTVKVNIMLTYFGKKHGRTGAVR
jgi:hypothetical protein